MAFLDFLYYLAITIAGVFLFFLIIIAFLVGRGLEKRNGPTGKPLTFHERIFYKVAENLRWFARLFKLSYQEVNIILYFFIIPFSWIVLLDMLFGIHYLKLIFVLSSIVFFLWVKDFRLYSYKLFNKSVDFLNYFNRYGSNYIVSSVWICVALPIAIYWILIYLVCR